MVGKYVRFDENTINQLKDLKRGIIAGLKLEDGGQEVYLIWGRPGNGKSYFPQELAKSLGADVTYIELNFAKQDEKEFRENVTKLGLKLSQTDHNDKQALLCFMDEIDSKSMLEASRSPSTDSTIARHQDSDQSIIRSGSWSYESLCPLLWSQR
ncbi:ATP-binding protein, partial [Candidatus Bathyarchaeota archaeon]|nr:ATP-binding protein [Candidatus Bathyarchaeota archaeon]